MHAWPPPPPRTRGQQNCTAINDGAVASHIQVTASLMVILSTSCLSVSQSPPSCIGMWRPQRHSITYPCLLICRLISSLQPLFVPGKICTGKRTLAALPYRKISVKWKASSECICNKSRRLTIRFFTSHLSLEKIRLTKTTDDYGHG